MAHASLLPTWRNLLGAAVLIAANALALPGAQAQTRPATAKPVAAPAGAVAAPAAPKKDQLLVEANELVYDREKDKVSAVGNAQLYYQGKTLEADRVNYDRKTKRVFAEGNARMTDATGTKYYGDRFELTDDFKNGFIDSLRSEAPDKQRFSAARAERVNGETSVFERGTYTACEPCKDNPSSPPLWQVRAARITHKTDEQTVYYEQATLEFWGLPVAYLPAFSSPDPTVNRKSGFLAPSIVARPSSLGYGAAIPYFWAIAPNMDMTITPTFLSKQGVLGQMDFRHRLNNGVYTIRAAGIFQQEPSAFLPDPLGAGNRRFRGSAETTGLFYLNEKWKWGWDIAASTDKYFYSNYNTRTESLSNTYRRESISTVFLNGQGERSWFDLRGYYFRPLTSLDWQKQQAAVHPVWDYDRRFSSEAIGGEIQVNANIASISRSAASFEALPDASTVGYSVSPSLFTGTTQADGKGRTYPYALYEGCYQYVPGRCLLRGMAGSYTRATLAVSWRRSFIDPLGQVWTPFASVRGDMAFVSMNTNRYGTDPANLTAYGNEKQRLFLSDDTDFSSRLMPTVGLEYRYPFIGRFGSTTHQIEPIAQLVLRPNEGRIGKLPNEDSHSLVFDDTVLFSQNKFSGYDRLEGGMRANYGLQYTITGDSGAYVNALFGQSIQLAGRNSYSKGDMINTGLDSGLESRRSDYVGRISIAPNSTFSLTARGRFDEETFALRRVELSANANFGPVSMSSTYARLAPQPNLGYNLRREGWLNTLRVQLPNNWFVGGSVLFDMDRYLSDRSYHLSNPTLYPTYNNSPFRLASTGLQVGYKDECTDFSFQWTRTTSDYVSGTKTSGSLFLLRLELKHLGQTQYRTTTGAYTASEAANGR